MASETTKPELKGVGGWLTFFIFILGIVSPTRMMLNAAYTIHDVRAAEQILGAGTATYITFFWCVVLLSVAVSLTLALLLLGRHRWSTVRIAIGGLWCLALLPTAADVIASMILFPGIAALGMPEILFSVGKSAISATLWTCYLLMSKRVANTYLKDVSETERIFG